MSLKNLSVAMLAVVTTSAGLSFAQIRPGAPPPPNPDNQSGVVVPGPVQPLPPGGVRPQQPGRPQQPQPPMPPQVGPVRPGPQPGPGFPGPQPGPGMPPDHGGHGGQGDHGGHGGQGGNFDPYAPGPIRPGPRPGPGYPGPIRPGPGPGYPPGPVYPGPVYPAPVYPGPVAPYPPQPPMPYPGQPDYNVSRTGSVARWVTNERLDLTSYVDLSGLGNDFVIDSVTVDLRGSAYNSRLDLAVNGVIEDSIVSPVELATLRSRSESLYGVQLLVGGQLYIDTLTVNMHRRSGYDPGGQSFDVPLNLNRRMSGQDQLDIGAYINLMQYRGYRIQSINVTANAIFNAAVIELLVNGFSSGQASIGQYLSTTVLVPQNSSVIGQGADSLVLRTSGEMNIQSVVLRLTR